MYDTGRVTPILTNHPTSTPVTGRLAAMTNGERRAETGELCTCGRQAILIYSNTRFGDVGWCGINGAATRPVLPCPWCGTTEPHLEPYGDPARCPEYALHSPTERK